MLGSGSQIEPSNLDVILSLRDLRISDPKSGKKLLKIDSLDLRRGEILGLVGPSGSGKTLTALSLMGLIQEQGLRVDGGSVIFDGIDMVVGSVARTRSPARKANFNGVPGASVGPGSREAML